MKATNMNNNTGLWERSLQSFKHTTLSGQSSEGNMCFFGFLAPEDCEPGSMCASIYVISYNLRRVAFHNTSHHCLKVVTENFSPPSVRDTFRQLPARHFFSPINSIQMCLRRRLQQSSFRCRNVFYLTINRTCG